MYVLERAMGLKWLAVVFAVFTAVAAFGIGNMVQANSVAVLAAETLHLSPILTGFVLTVLTGVVILGGIRSIAEAETVLNAGAEKISVNSPALADPELIDRLSRRFGSQCVVVGVDSLSTPGGYRVHQYTGDPNRDRDTGRDTRDWVREVQDRGAGEIVLNCMASDGVRQGYDVVQLRTIREICQVPLIASGGAGAPEHFRDVFCAADVDGALAASVFHSGTLEIVPLKQFLRDSGIEVRP